MFNVRFKPTGGILFPAAAISHTNWKQPCLIHIHAQRDDKYRHGWGSHWTAILSSNEQRMNEWHRRQTQFDAEKWFFVFLFFIFTYSLKQLCKEFQAMFNVFCSTGETYENSCTSQHPQNNTSNKSWAQGMCNTSPASRHTVPVGTRKDWEQHPGIIIASDKYKEWAYIQIEKKKK